MIKKRFTFLSSVREIGLDVATEKDKKSVFDVLCKNKHTEEQFVLEMHTTYESVMNDRLYYYGVSLIHNQVSSRDMEYKVNSVIILCVASYRVPHKEKVPAEKVFFKYQMRESETHEVFDGDKLSICFLELNRFDNYLDNDEDLKKQWCWIFNNISTFAVRPEHLDPSFDSIINDSGTKKLTYQQKILANMSVLQREQYDKIMEDALARLSEMNTAREMGREEGREEGRDERNQEIANIMLGKGFDVKTIAECLGISEEEVRLLSQAFTPQKN